MRGEHLFTGYINRVKGGSSPHARGARNGKKIPSSTAGIIPACAGSTAARIASTKSTRDHPRMRGEHLVAAGEERTREGSSPHARGALLLDRMTFDNARIIPACAGSTPG